MRKEHVMRYDPDNVNLIYDSRQFLSVEDERDLIVQQREQIIRGGFKQLHPKTLAAAPLQTFLSILALLLFLGLIAGFIVALKMGHPAIGMMLFGTLFLAGGLMMAFSGKSAEDNSVDSAHGTRTVGVLFAMLGLMFIVSMALIPVIGPAHAFIGLAGAGFAWGGSFFSLDVIRQMRRTRKTYGEMVPARCIGYARSIHHTKNRSPWLRTHEIFEYEYNGECYQAINPESSDRNAMMPVGEQVEVHIHPKRPDEPVYADDGRSPVSSSIAGLSFCSLFVIVGTGLLLFTVFGDVDEADFKVYNRLAPQSSESTLENGKDALTDEIIQSQTGDPAINWEIAKYKITEKYQDEKDRYLLRFSDGTIHAARKEVWDTYKTGLAFYQITDAENGKSLAVYDCASWEYTGEHTLADYTAD